MKRGNSKLLIIALIVVIAIAIISNVIVTRLWSSPGGSAYGTGFPVPYHDQFCGGYAPCYWAPIFQTALLEDILFWLVIFAIILFIAKYLKGRKKK